MVLETGLRVLDRMITGLRGSELVVIASRPGVGKSSLAQKFIGTCLEQGSPVALFSNEMSPSDILQRLISQRGRVPREAFVDKEVGMAYKEIIYTEGERLGASSDLHIQERAFPQDFNSFLMKAKRISGLGLVVVDYLDLIISSDRGITAEDVVTSLKALAVSLDVPVVLTSHLTREVEHRDDHRPRISDMRNSEAIAQGADTIMLLYRKDMYSDDLYSEDAERDGTAELKVIRRKGPMPIMGTVQLGWIGKYTLFHDLDEG